MQESVTKEFRENVMVVSNLDKASKKICNNLSHFVVVLPSANNISGEFTVSAIGNICENRNAAELPALVIHADVLNEMNTNSNEFLSLRLSKFFNALDMSLKYKYNNVVTREYKKDVGVEFMNKLSQIIGISYLGAIEETRTLYSLKISEACLDEVRDLLYRNFNIDYSTEELLRFSIASLLELSFNTKPNTRSMEGLRAFYNHIERKEIFAAEPIVIMSSKIASCSEKTPEELNSKEPHLIMIPGFEGHSRIFSSIGERLKIQAASLQLSPDLEGDNIPQMAHYLLKHLKAIFQFNSKFYILGYSFGVNIALEIAAMLEKEGYEGVVYCLDSSPDAIKVHLNSFLGKSTQSELQNSIIVELYRLITGGDIDNLLEELRNLDDWSRKVEHTVQKLRKTETHSYDYLKAIIESTYKRIQLVKAYKPDFKLESKIVLIKGIRQPKSENLADDYNLSKYTKQPVSVFPIESEHTEAPFDVDVSNIVNRMLEPKLLEEYKNQNLCEVYTDDKVKIQVSKISALRVVGNKKKPNLIA